MSNNYELTFTRVDDIVRCAINDETINISSFGPPSQYKRDITAFVQTGLNTVEIVAENRTRQAACVGSITKNGETINSWGVELADGSAGTGPFLSETFRFVD